MTAPLGALRPQPELDDFAGEATRSLFFAGGGRLAMADGKSLVLFELGRGESRALRVTPLATHALPEPADALVEAGAGMVGVRCGDKWFIAGDDVLEVAADDGLLETAPDPRDPVEPTSTRPEPEIEGGVVVRRDGRGERPPCRQRLPFAVERLERAGRFLLALTDDGTQMALLDPEVLQLLHHRSLGRGGASVVAAADSDFLLVRTHHPSGSWHLLDLLEVEEMIDPIHHAFPSAPVESATFVGHNAELPAIDPARKRLGPTRVLLVPVTEAGQAFNDSTVSRFSAWMQANCFAEFADFFAEASFNQMSVDVAVLGDGVGPADGPIELPRAIRSYFWPPFFAGGVRAELEPAATPHAVVFNGNESLKLHLKPRERAPLDVMIPFSALGASREHSFPASVVLNGTETVTLEVTDGAGSAKTLAVKFAAKTFTMAAAADVATGLSGLAAHVQTALDAAAGAAGLASGVKLTVKARRVKVPGRDFGRLDLDISLAPGPGGGKGRVRLTAHNAAALGFNTSAPGDFTLPADTARLATRMERAVGHGASDAGFDFNSSPLGTPEVRWDPVDDKVITSIVLAGRDGGDGASASVVSTSGLDELGFGAAVAVPGVSDVNDANALKDAHALLDDIFTAAYDRLGSVKPLQSYPTLYGERSYDAVLIGFVGAPPTSEWGASEPDWAGLRMFTRVLTANHKTVGASWTARFIGSELGANPDESTLCHEYGHALGLPDLYHENEHRDDLRYMDGWDLMCDHGQLPHPGGAMKYCLGWIPKRRIAGVDLPNPGGPSRTEALLVPLEWWDHGMEAAVRAAFGGTLPIVSLMAIDLGGDGLQFDLVEARQRGPLFSQGLPATAGLIVTNCLNVNDDTRYAVNDKYRRKVHRLNTGGDLRSAGDAFDLAAAPELAAVGVDVEVVATRDVARPGGAVRVFHVAVGRAQADYVDLAFTDPVPNWTCPDVWVDWVGDNPSADPADHHVYPLGTPHDQGEVVRTPTNGPEPHWVVGRIHNRGTAPAKNVKVNAYKSDPPGTGDRGNFVLFDVETLSEVPAGGFVTLPLKWEVQPGENRHQCLRLEIADWELPLDPTGVMALASDDLWTSNNWGQKNVSTFTPASHSPYDPVEFEISINNDGTRRERAYLEAEGLPLGMTLTVTPRRATIAAGRTKVFRCTLDLDEHIIGAGCHNDRMFEIVTWRETPESCERWGGCRYVVRPRKRAVVDTWAEYGSGTLYLGGQVRPNPGGGQVHVQVTPDDKEPIWLRTQLEYSGDFYTSAPVPPHHRVEIIADFDGNAAFAPARSQPRLVYT